MFYIIPSDSFNTPDRINNSREGGRERGKYKERKEADPGGEGGGPPQVRLVPKTFGTEPNPVGGVRSSISLSSPKQLGSVGGNQALNLADNQLK